MRAVVTGAAGFIGSNLVHGLNAIGVDDVIAVDNLTDGPKYRNLLGAAISDYFDKSEFYSRFAKGEFGKIDVVLHQGACSDTMEHNGRYMLENNYRCSKDLLDACLAQGTRLLYASSAATYGASDTFREEPPFEQPLNVYGYSKLLFDNIVRRMLPVAPTQVAGFRYFNVYGPREQHKGRMASVALHHFNEYRSAGKVKLFGEYGGYASGMQSRDFVFVDDVVAVNLWFVRAPGEERHLQSRHRSRPAVQRSGNGGGQRRRGCSRRCAALPLAELVAPEHHRIHRLPAGAGRQVPVPHPSRPGHLRAVGCDHAFADVAHAASSATCNG